VKLFLLFALRAMPFTIGLGAVLVGLCFLVHFVDYGLDFDASPFWVFCGCFATGLPTLLFGIERLTSRPI
jgi:hypothetical protein